ncbi:MAG: hypothetical protein LBB11_02265 [Puniceicoccales bacterium]|jgi:hypothetical protein|nr:hypothetical protein [Puniceicoccales bacterium]
MSATPKIFVIIALLGCFGAVKYILSTRNQITSHSELRIEQKVKREPMTIQRKTVHVQDLLWKEPEIAEKGVSWTFDLFTAPTISREREKFSAFFPWMKKNQSAINFEVISMDKKRYPLQFGGYFSTPHRRGVASANSECVFILRDVNTQETFIAKLGQRIEKYGIEIKKFEEKGPEDTVVGYPQLTVFDTQNQQQEILTREVKYDETSRDIRLRSKIDGRDISIARIGETFTVNNEIYTLENINFESNFLEFSQKVGKEVINFSLPIPENKTDIHPDKVPHRLQKAITPRGN